MSEYGVLVVGVSLHKGVTVCFVFCNYLQEDLYNGLITFMSSKIHL